LTGRVNRKVLANWLFGATPGHPLLHDALDKIEPQATFGPYDPTRGTDGPFFTTIVIDRDDVTIFDIGTFFQEGKSVGYAVPESAAAVHHGSRTWARETLDAAVARLDMLERELADAHERLRGYESGAEVGELLAQVRRLETKHAAAHAKLTHVRSELAELRAEMDRLRLRRRLRRFASTAKRLVRGT
jgi:BMFP domain-containing protein YqiC